MDTKNWISVIFILVLVYLLAVNSSGSSKVIESLSTGLMGTITTLQGRKEQ